MHAKLRQSCLTLSDLMDVAHQAPLSLGILQAKILEWVAMPSSHPGIKPASLASAALAAGFLTASATWEAHI